MRKIKIILSLFLILSIMTSAVATVSAATATTTAVSSEGAVKVTATGDESAIIKFTPKETGYYSITTNTSLDTVCEVMVDGEYFADDDDGGDLKNFKLVEKFTAGITYDIEVFIWDFITATFDVNIEKTLDYITDLKIITPPQNVTYVKEYVDGYVDFWGMSLRVTKANGETFDWNYDDDFAFENLNLTFDTTDSESQKKVTLAVNEAKVDIPLNIIDNPVKSIELITTNVTPLEEGVNGIDFGGFIYSVDFARFGIKVNYKDGSSVTAASVDDPIKGYYTDYYDNQFEALWQKGGKNNTVYFEYLGFTAEYNMTIIDNPVKSITINSVPTRQYMYGDSEYGEFIGGQYYFQATDFTGLAFTVNFKNGTTKKYTYKDIDNDEWMVDGYWFSVENEYSVSAGKIPVTLNYRGVTATYNVTLKEPPVSKIEITKTPTHQKIPNYNFSADYLGLELKLTYKNGQTKTVIADKSTLKYEYDPDLGLYSYLLIDGYKANIYCYDNSRLIVEYLGLSAEADYLVTVEDKQVLAVVCNDFGVDGKLNITVDYNDGTKSDYEIVPVCFKNLETIDGIVTYYAGRSRDGIVIYNIQNLYDNGKYKAEILNHVFETQVAVLAGDLDFSGDTDLNDVVILAQRVAGWNIPCNIAALDPNGDGEVNLNDVVHLAQYVAGWSVSLK